MSDLIDPARSAKKQAKAQSLLMQQQEQRQKIELAEASDEAARAGLMPNKGRRSLIKTSASGVSNTLGGT